MSLPIKTLGVIFRGELKGWPIKNVIFLAADSASMITGTSLYVDGGWTAQ